MRYSNAAERKEEEIRFHNDREKLRREDKSTHDTIYTNRKFYKTTSSSKAFLEKWYHQHTPGKKVLDYCCGTGATALKLATMGAEVTGVDISDESIDTCVARAKELEFSGTTNFHVMDAEKLSFPDDSFDVVVCSGVLHHLDLAAAFKEISRVLRPDGIVICIEALANNPLIDWYRRKTPNLRTAWEVDHILTTGRIKEAYAYFESVDIRYFHLASIAAIPFIGRIGFEKILSLLNGVDYFLMRIPLVNRLAWQAIFTLENPKSLN